MSGVQFARASLKPFKFGPLPDAQDRGKLIGTRLGHTATGKQFTLRMSTAEAGTGFILALKYGTFYTMKHALFSLFLLCASLSGTSVYAQKTAKAPKAGQRVWTVAQTLAAKRRDKPRKPIDYCNGGRFKPCVCYQDVAREMQYRPAFEECGGNAGVMLTGKYGGAFSAVVRDSENRDRFPLPGSGYGGCSFELANAINPPNSCSAFKAQSVVRVGSGRDKGKLYCLGASGYSKTFSRVTRVTAKLADSPNSSDDPIVRWCLRRPTLPLN